MAWHSKITDGTPWGTDSPEMKENADMIASVMINKYHWTLPAICGLLGNCSAESFLNPGQYELGHGTPTSPYGWGYGVGLIQWTSPDGGRSYPNPWLYYCQKNGVQIDSGEAQCEMINGCDSIEYTAMGLPLPIWGWINDSSYPTHSSYEDFKNYTGDDIDREVELWFYCCEWHDPVEDGSLSNRRKRGREWWEYFGGHPIPPTPPTPSGKKKMPLWMYLKRF